MLQHLVEQVRDALVVRSDDPLVRQKTEQIRRIPWTVVTGQPVSRRPVRQPIQQRLRLRRAEDRRVRRDDVRINCRTVENPGQGHPPGGGLGTRQQPRTRIRNPEPAPHPARCGRPGTGRITHHDSLLLTCRVVHPASKDAPGPGTPGSSGSFWLLASVPIVPSHVGPWSE
ncbi:MAG: hypothetical protein JXA67_03160 [Micromonosporaceae bacterium]|nr:hypothetical protein [Micromonosporaceae bacterium]